MDNLISNSVIIIVGALFLCGFWIYLLLRLSEPRNDRKKAFKPRSMDKIKNDVIVHANHRPSMLDAMVRDMSSVYNPAIDRTTTPPRGTD